MTRPALPLPLLRQKSAQETDRGGGAVPAFPALDKTTTTVAMDFGRVTLDAAG